MVKAGVELMFKQTRYASMTYACIGRGHWMFFDMSGRKPAQVGPNYASEAELLADLHRYCGEYFGDALAA